MSDDPRNAADRVRHILQAMERSIATARRRRLNDGQDPQSTEQPATPSAVPNPPESRTDQSSPRLRARPKRPSNIVSNFDDPTYRSQAG